MSPKMLKFISLFLILGACLTVEATETNLDISNNNAASPGLSSRTHILVEMSAKVLGLQLYAFNTASQEAANINKLEKVIKLTVEVSTQIINEQLNDLENQVKNSTGQAKSSTQSIGSCIRKEELGKLLKIRAGRIQQCKKTFSFDTLKLKLAKLEFFKDKATNIIPECSLLHPLINENLKNCIQKQIDGTYSTVNLIKLEIHNDAVKIYDEATNCVNDNRRILYLDIEEISKVYGTN